MQERYVTLGGLAEDEFTERRSRFLCAALPVTTPEQALAFVAERKAAHREARHTVWAYLLRDGQARCSDDGEPQGTGGQPALEVLRREGVVDACVAVTRYFGGVLLGAGGLTRAYSGGAALALSAARRVVMTRCLRCTVEVDYPRFGAIERLLPTFGARVEDSDYGERVTLTLLLQADRFAPLCRALGEATAGDCRPQEQDTCFAADMEDA